MARKTIEHNQDNIQRLKAFCITTYGTPIESLNDVLALQISIEKTIGQNISTQTLRRFFGLVKSATNTSLTILNICSNYCGFLDWENFCSRSTTANHNFKLLTVKEEANIYKDFFNIQIPAISKQHWNEGYFYACKNIFKRLFDCVDLYDELVPTLLKNEAGISYGMERFIPINGLCKGFDRGYELYLQVKKKPQEQIFGNCILFLGAAFSLNIKNAKIYLDRINSNNILQSNHPFVFARYLGSNILYYHLINDEKNKQVWLNKIEEINRLEPNKFGFETFNNLFELMIAEYLYLANEYELAYKYMQVTLLKFNNAPKAEINDFWYQTTQILLYSLKLQLSYKIDLDKNIQNIKTAEIHNYHLLLIFFKAQFNKKSLKQWERNALVNKVNLLVKKSGFTFFSI